ncbi:MAG: hypothetical protein AAGE84_19355 [Cyanobacteria bacterium P01_G01_bin.39]
MTSLAKRELISDQEKRHVTKVIGEILTKYDAKASKQDVEDFCKEFVEERDGLKETNKVIGEVNEGLETIDSIENFYQDLVTAQDKGKSKLHWFKVNIKNITNIKDAQEIAKIVGEIQSEFNKANNKQLSSLLDEDVTVFTPEQKSTDAQEACSRALGSIQNNSLINIVSIGQQVESLIENFGLEGDNSVNVAQKYFEDDFSNGDLKLKKLVTCGLVIASEEFHIEALDGVDGAGIAVMVDMGLTIAKVGNLLSQGKIKADKALSHIYDRSIAGGCAVVKKAFEAKGMIAGATIGGTVGTVFGPIGTAVGGTIGAVAGKYAGNYISKPVTDGIKSLAQRAKAPLMKAVESAGNTIKNAGEKISRGFEKARQFLFG